MTLVGIILINVDTRDLVSPILDLGSSLDPHICMTGGFVCARHVLDPTTVQPNSYSYILSFFRRRKNGEKVNKELDQEISYQISMVLKSVKSGSAAAVLQAPSIYRSESFERSARFRHARSQLEPYSETVRYFSTSHVLA